MLDLGDDDFVTRTQDGSLESASDNIDRVCRSARKDDLMIRRRVQETRGSSSGFETMELPVLSRIGEKPIPDH